MTGSGVPGRDGPPPREVCIVMLSALGDAVHVLPVATALKRAWPLTRITWVAQPPARALVGRHPAVDEFLVFHRSRGLAGLSDFVDYAGRIRERRFDLLLGLQVYAKAGILTALASAKVKLGFDRERARDLQWLFTTHRIPPHAPQHVQDQYFEFVRWLGVDPEPVTWDLLPDERERQAQAAFFASLDRPACAVVVATSDPRKNWHAAGWARVLDAVERDHGLRPVLVGGPSAAERRIADEILALTSARVVDTLGDDVRRLVWLLGGSALTISPDTGPLHVSRAVGTPVVGLFGSTNPKRSGPYRAFQDLVVDGYAEHPGDDYPVTQARRDGMRRITADMVLEKVALAMERYVPR
jgi:heptosyltransferase I